MSDVVDVDAASSVHAEEGKGKSNEGAFAQLVNELEQVVMEERNAAFSFMNLFVLFHHPRSTTMAVLLSVWALVLLGAFAIGVVQGRLLEALDWLVTALLLLLVLMFVSLIAFVSQRYERLQLVLKVKAHLRYYRTHSDPYLDGRIPPDQSFFTILRDGIWRRLPISLAVVGDAVKLKGVGSVPCRLRSDSAGCRVCILGASATYSSVVGIEYNAGDSVVLEEREQSFILLETPAVEALRHLMKCPRRRPTATQQLITRSERYVRYLIAVSLVVAVVVNAVKFAAQFRSQSWVELLVVRPIYQSLPLLLPGALVLIIAMEYIGHALLLALFDHAHRVSLKRHAEEFRDDEEQLQTAGHVPFTLQLEYVFKLMFRGSFTPLAYPSELVQRLGSTTVVSCPDKEGVLSDNISYITSISLLQIRSDADDAGMVERDVISLGLSRDPDSKKGAFRFNDLDWEERYLAHLKPLGLNTLLNTHCSFGAYPGTYGARTIFCGSKAIGFVEGVLDSYEPLVVIHRIAHEVQVEEVLPEHQQMKAATMNVYTHMQSALVQEKNSGRTQLLSKGDPSLILEHCTHGWHGSGIQELSEKEREGIERLTKKWSAYRCIAFSYKPVKTEHASVFEQHGTLGMAEKDRGTCSWRNSVGGGSVLESSLRFSLAATEQFLDEVQSGEIYIGMIALRQLPRYEVPAAIEALKEAGVRFVHYSAGPERPSKLFAEKLGLECDWNSSICLCESPGLEVSHDNTPARLPRGISSIRNHIETVDNVPLLVSLFYDCTPSTSLEMTRIFQEHSHIVCCVGNTLLPHNLRAFKQADISFGYVPTPTLCLNASASGDGRQSIDTRKTLELSSTNFADAPTSGALACDMASLPCAGILGSHGSFHMLLDMIVKARSLLVNSSQALRFFFAANLVLHFAILFGQITLLPTLMPGYLIVWFMVIIIPFMSLQLLFAAEEPGIRRDIADTSAAEEQTIKRHARYLAWQVLPSAGVLVIVFACTLGLVWPSASVGGVFGFKQPINDREYRDAIRIAQHVTAVAFVGFVMCMSFCNLQRKEPLFNGYRPCGLYFSLWWIVFSCVALATQLAIMFLAINVNVPDLAARGWPVIFLCCAWPVVICCVEFWVKRKYMKWYDRNQRFLRLEYDTKLGMHSPVSPFADRWM